MQVKIVYWYGSMTTLYLHVHRFSEWLACCLWCSACCLDASISARQRSSSPLNWSTCFLYCLTCCVLDWISPCSTQMQQIHIMHNNIMTNYLIHIYLHNVASSPGHSHDFIFNITKIGETGDEDTSTGTWYISFLPAGYSCLHWASQCVGSSPVLVSVAVPPSLS